MQPVKIKGVEKTSMIDYPGKICTVIFTGGCNLRCPFCQNPNLVKDFDQYPDLELDKILLFIKSRKQWIDGVCITGGEPLLYEGIIDCIKQIKKIGLLVKLDTNGMNPKLLKKIIDEKIVDYIAMDIKTDLEHYGVATGVKNINLDKIKESVELIKNSGIDYEFRSTVVPDFFDEQIIRNIGAWLKGSKKYYFQQFRSTLPLVDKSFEGKQPYTEDVLKKFKEILKEYVEIVEIRS